MGLSEWLGHAVNSMVWGVSCAGVAVVRSSLSPEGVIENIVFKSINLYLSKRN